MNDPGVLGRILLRASAAAALVVGGVLWWRSAHLTTPVPARETYTAAGRPDSIVLRDGSTVLLAPGGSLTVEEGYGMARRDVAIVGEAQFMVLHDGARPFRVIAGEAVIRVLGTTFIVRTDGAQGIEVAVLNGTVLLSHPTARPGQGVTVNAGERGVLSRDGRASVERAR
jgi:transmembrane sensor